MNDWITSNMLEFARTCCNAQNRDICKEIFEDAAIERKAKVIISSWEMDKTVKDIIDDWIYYG